MQVYDMLTMLVINVSNLHEMITHLAADDLTSAITSLYISIDEELQRHNCYLIDCLEGRIIVVAGECFVAERLCSRVISCS